MNSKHTLTVHIIGYGNQARAWAQNLRDNGHNVHIVLRKHSAREVEVRQQQFNLIELEDFSPIDGDILAILTPDNCHKEILDGISKRCFTQRLTCIYAHGYSYVAFELKNNFPHWQHLLLAPKAIATELRARFIKKEGLSAVISDEGALDRQLSHDLLLHLCHALGINVGPFDVTFKQEADADMFSEQAILCGALPFLGIFVYQRMIEHGISPELAYLESWYEIQLIASTMTKLGPQKFFEMISPNALHGAIKASDRLFDKAFQERLDGLAQEIWSGKFYQEAKSLRWHEDLEKVRNTINKSDLEDIHKQLGPKLFG